MRTRITLSAAIGVLLVTASHSMAQGGHPDSVEDFVLAVHTRGFSVEDARKYSTDADRKTLTRLLKEKTYAQFWPNITKVIGIVGSDSEVALLIDFVHGVPAVDPSSSADFRGRASAVSSLGYLARHAKAPALDYLLGSVDPKVWHGQAPWLSDRASPAWTGWAREHLSASAVQGLALSRCAEAAEKLRELAAGRTDYGSIRRAAELGLARIGHAPSCL